MIPKQLHNSTFRFILLRSETKIPLEKDWTNTNNYSFDDPKLQTHLKNGGNIGIVCGINNLVVIDFDSQKVQDKVLPKLPKGLKQKSGGGLIHAFFLTDNAENIKILDKDKNTLVDIQGPNKQIVIAPSIHPNGKQYVIVEDSDIPFLPMAEIKAFFVDYLEKPHQEERKGKIDKPPLKEVLRKYGVDTSRNPTQCPWHNSKGGKCFSFNEDVYHCFHCDKSGDSISFVMEQDGCDFKEACVKLDIKIEKKQVDKQWDEVLPGLKIDNFTDNAKRFYKVQPFFYDKQELFWFWKADHWERVDDVDVERTLDKKLGFMGQTVSSNLRKNHSTALKWLGREKEPKPSKKHWIQFKDKAFTLTKKTVYEVTPDYFFTNPIPWELGKTDETPIMDNLFAEWVGDKYMQTLYELIAYCTYTDYPIQVLFCLYGHGRNGKSRFLALLSKFIGNENHCSTELDLLVGNSSSRFESSKLYKKLVCQMGETNFGTLNKSSLLKKLTGGDMIGFELKGKNPFDDVNYAKIIIASNSLPSSDDTSEGFYRRWVIIDFPNQFPEGKDILETIPEQEYNNLARKCINILPGLLKEGAFTNQGDISERKDKYIMASNPLPIFIKLCCEKEDRGFVSYGELYTAYVQFLNKLKKRKVKQMEFKTGLENEGFWVERTSKYINSQSQSGRWIEGLILRFDWKEKLYDICDNLHSIPTPKTGYVEELGIKSQKAYKSQNIINHKCSVCGSTPCITFTSSGKPICQNCKDTMENNNIKVEQIEE